MHVTALHNHSPLLRSEVAMTSTVSNCYQAAASQLCRQGRASGGIAMATTMAACRHYKCG